MIRDLRNLVMTGIDADGVNQFERVVEQTLTFLPEGAQYLNSLLEKYPAFTLGWVFKAYIEASDGRRSTLANIAARVSHIESLSFGSTQRESLHIQALKQWSGGNLKGAMNTWQQILSVWPLDIIAYRQLLGQLFWFGQKARALHVSKQILPYWDSHVPGFWMFAASHAFALEEAGEYEISEAFARQTLQLNSADLIAKHTLAHLYEMQGRPKEGIDFLEKSASTFYQHNAFRGHLWWHLALFYLEQGRVDDALSLFDKQIYPSESSLYLDIQNAASLLIRLEFLGVDVGNRWSGLVDSVNQNSQDSTIMFTEVHNAMVLARTENNRKLDLSIEHISQQPLVGQQVEFSVAAMVMKGISAYHSAQYHRAIECIGEVQHHYYQLGGSHAQQDVLFQYLIMSHAYLQNWQRVSSLLKTRYMARASAAQSEISLKQKFAQFDLITNIDALLPHLSKVL